MESRSEPPSEKWPREAQEQWLGLADSAWVFRLPFLSPAFAPFLRKLSEDVLHQNEGASHRKGRRVQGSCTGEGEGIEEGADSCAPYDSSGSEDTLKAVGATTPTPAMQSQT